MHNQENWRRFCSSSTSLTKRTGLKTPGAIFDVGSARATAMNGRQKP
jgi:hypothetical protein